MSSSRRKDLLTCDKPALRNGKAKVLPCPECGERAMRRVSGPCVLGDDAEIPNLERLHCTACEEDFFDDDAMAVIEGFRARRKSRRPATGAEAR